MSAKHLTTDADCTCGPDNCGLHRDDEAREHAYYAPLFSGAVLAGEVLPAGVEREVSR